MHAEPGGQTWQKGWMIMASVRVYRNELPVWTVGMKNTRTGEKINLEVTGSTNEEATRKCTSLFGHNGDYQWTGTGPLYEEKGEGENDIKNIL